MIARILGVLATLSLALSLHVGTARAAPLPANPVPVVAADQGLVQTVQHWRHHHHFGWGHHHHHHWRPRRHRHWGHHHHHHFRCHHHHF